MDELIDVIEGNRKYMKCIYVYNKIDVIGIDDVDKLARQPNSVVISCNLKAGFTHTSPIILISIGKFTICSSMELGAINLISQDCKQTVMLNGLVHFCLANCFFFLPSFSITCKTHVAFHPISTQI